MQEVIIEYISQNIWAIFIISIVVFIVSLLFITYLLLRIPHDYFSDNYIKKSIAHPIFRFIKLIVKNMLGIVFFFLGVIMIFTPGQGILTILVGIILMDLPYKKQIEKRLISQPKILHLINSIRHKHKHLPLEID
ncbi:MAG: hypothetical protein ISS11_00035 [Candidatus Marinimicrobia bacterium]|nr:hypothetical protein [Candidatus Neomarinimicrobiota bacterium]